jgi:3-oxoacyl-[acyl-carrier protein] reductase
MGTDGTALVTGAGRGLGAAIAMGLARLGHTVAVNDLPGVATVDDVVAGITAAGGSALAAPADVTDEERVRELVRRLGRVDVLVVNATRAQPVVTVDALTWQHHLDQLELFVKSPTLLVQAVLPGMRDGGGGRVIMIGSDMPDRALPGWSAYSAAKSAQLALTRCWARELGPDHITVNLVAPGWIPVERHLGEVTDAYAATVPLRRMGTPADIAAAVGYLASADAAFVTGQVLAVNGGQTVGN